MKSVVRLDLARGLALVVGGLALTLAFPRTDWEALAWIAIVPLLVTALDRPPRPAFFWGWLWSATFFVTLLRWLDYTFLTYSAIPWPITWVPILALGGYCALYPALVAAGVSWIARRSGPGRALAAAPFLWVAGEWVRGHLMGGFPWGAVGYSQYRALPVIQVAELGGIDAVTMLVVIVNAAIAGALRLAPRRALAGIGLASVALAASLGFGLERLRVPASTGEVNVALMQPSIEQPLKWDERYTEQTLRIYFSMMNAAAAEGPDLVVWPETAAPTILRRDRPLLEALTDLSGRSGVPQLMGSVDAEGAPPKLRNTAFLITGRGIIDRYDKIHLVPFGEYVPLAGVIGFVRGWAEFIAELEPGSRPVVFPGPPAPFGVVICYEGIFPDLVREFVGGGARLLVNMTNDGWFGRTSGPLQHLAMYPFRAIEHRIAVVRSANTGVSAVIQPTGRISASLGLFERGVLRGRVPLRQGETLYTRLGDWLAYLALAVSGASMIATFARGVRHAG